MNYGISETVNKIRRVNYGVSESINKQDAVHKIRRIGIEK